MLLLGVVVVVAAVVVVVVFVVFVAASSLQAWAIVVHCRGCVHKNNSTKQFGSGNQSN